MRYRAPPDRGCDAPAGRRGAVSTTSRTMPSVHAPPSGWTATCSDASASPMASVELHWQDPGRHEEPKDIAVGVGSTSRSFVDDVRATSSAARCKRSRVLHERLREGPSDEYLRRAPGCGASRRGFDEPARAYGSGAGHRRRLCGRLAEGDAGARARDSRAADRGLAISLTASPRSEACGPVRRALTSVPGPGERSSFTPFMVDHLLRGASTPLRRRSDGEAGVR